MKHSLVVAHHEAGHGVIAYALGVKLRRLQVNEDSSGIVEIATALRRSDLEDWSDFLVGSGHRSRIERYTIINLAGPYAQRRVAPWSNWKQRQHDHYPGGKTDFSPSPT